MEWVQNFIKLSKEFLARVNSEIPKYQKEFKLNALSIYSTISSEFYMPSEDARVSSYFAAEK